MNATSIHSRIRPAIDRPALATSNAIAWGAAYVANAIATVSRTAMLASLLIGCILAVPFVFIYLFAVAVREKLQEGKERTVSVPAFAAQTAVELAPVEAVQVPVETPHASLETQAAMFPPEVVADIRKTVRKGRNRKTKAEVKVTAKSVRAAIVRLNNNFGRGDVATVSIVKGTFTRIPHQCNPETRKFRIVGNTVHALGHQVKIS